MSAAVTVRVSLGLVIPLRPSAVVPVANVEASPWLPELLETVATDVVPDAQVT